ncbi:hypothetical protein HDK77DRAFT_99935 [Phyllosticta capitalensis]|uniref:Uncharacterized protein n=1 Tax=Phyllosticta capitalensis TaxID=121624 RepID=A0ABR1YBQ0_9PEZI
MRRRWRLARSGLSFNVVSQADKEPMKPSDERSISTAKRGSFDVSDAVRWWMRTTHHHEEGSAAYNVVYMARSLQPIGRGSVGRRAFLFCHHVRERRTTEPAPTAPLHGATPFSGERHSIVCACIMRGHVRRLIIAKECAFRRTVMAGLDRVLCRLCTADKWSKRATASMALTVARRQKQKRQWQRKQIMIKRKDHRRS